jgi:predicted dinucleotide-binding enzyme
MSTLLIFGLGYSGRAVADRALAEGWTVIATSRSLPGPREAAPDAAMPASGTAKAMAAPPDTPAGAGVQMIAFDAAAPAIAAALGYDLDNAFERLDRLT